MKFLDICYLDFIIYLFFSMQLLEELLEEINSPDVNLTVSIPFRGYNSSNRMYKR